MRLATFNVENLFERAAIFQVSDPVESRALSTGIAELNALFDLPTYGPADTARMTALLKRLKLDKSDSSALALLRQNKGRLRNGARGANPLAIIAKGRADWVGHAEMKTVPVNAAAITNTGAVIRKVGADVLAVVEAESRPALVRFIADVLRRDPDYRHAMLIDGNDERGIDVGVMSKAPYAVRNMVSHVDDLGPKGTPIFSRDCPEFEILLPGGQSLWLLVNHFASKLGGKGADARRQAQAERVRALYLARRQTAELVAVLGDFNDNPQQPPLRPLLEVAELKDVAALPGFVDGGLKGTYKACGPAEKIDFILLSPALQARMRGGGLERSGIFDGRARPKWAMLPGVTGESSAASDHAALWVDLDL